MGGSGHHLSIVVEIYIRHGCRDNAALDSGGVRCRAVPQAFSAISGQVGRGDNR